MVLEEQNIMFVLRATQQAGTENVVLQLCEFFKPLVNKIVVVAAEGFNKQKLEELGGKYYAIPDIENKSPKTVLNIRKTIKRIAKEENIEITEEEIDAEVAKMAAQYGMEADKLKEYMGEAEKTSMKRDLAVMKAVDLIMDNVKERAKAKSKKDKDEEATEE